MTHFACGVGRSKVGDRSRQIRANTNWTDPDRATGRVLIERSTEELICLITVNPAWSLLKLSSPTRTRSAKRLNNRDTIVESYFGLYLFGSSCTGLWYQGKGLEHLRWEDSLSLGAGLRDINGGWTVTREIWKRLCTPAAPTKTCSPHIKSENEWNHHCHWLQRNFDRLDRLCWIVL